jgi:hypothetical protein
VIEHRMIGHMSGPPARTISHIRELSPQHRGCRKGGIIPEGDARSRKLRRRMRPGAPFA